MSADGTQYEIPAWMLGEEDVEVPEFEDVPERARPRGLYDLPIFEAFWRADAADLNC